MFAEYLMNDLATSDVACDLPIWIDIQRERQPHKDEFVICQTMDEAALLNKIYGDPGDLFNLVPEKVIDEEAVVDYRTNDCNSNDRFMASRDIQAGEQF
jgi:hypothetical protein